MGVAGGGGGAVGALRYSGHRQWWLGQARQVRRRQQSRPLCQVSSSHEHLFIVQMYTLLLLHCRVKEFVPWIIRVLGYKESRHLCWDRVFQEKIDMMKNKT